MATLRRLANYRGPIDAPPADLTIDTGQSSAEQSAAAIVAHFSLAAVTREERYPEVPA